ncbi:MAG: hypothetical protein IT427_12005 [Pirellulales bacterium]|nr:hypothetical protein [Pirellulales bacterium]
MKNLRSGSTRPRACSRRLAIVAILATASLALTDHPLLAAGPQSNRAIPKGYRKLGPGVETTIAPKIDTNDTVTQHDVVEIQSAGSELDWKPDTQSPSTTLKALTQNIPFRRSVWYLEFIYKPLRMIDVEMPDADGKMEKKTVWYLIYRVKNLGGHLQPAAKDDGHTHENELVDYPVRFFPQFILESQEYQKAYLDRVLPLAIPAIEHREDPNRRLLDSVEISKTPIEVSKPGEDKSVWGVAMWTDIDPRIDFFSIYVKGLTNAYRFVDPPGAYQKGKQPGYGRRIAQKTLKLNFWRPGDTYDVNEREFYSGIPGKVDHEWIFR